MFDILIALAITVLAICMALGKSININITHVHKVDQPEVSLPAQLTDDDVKDTSLQDLAAAVQNVLYDFEQNDVGGQNNVK